MTPELKEKQIRELKESIINSVNKKVAESAAKVSVREKNLILNDFEYAMGKITLESMPEGIGIGAHYKCNAKCIFCLGGKPKLFSLESYKDFFEPRLRSVISKVRYLNFCGFGELLLMPDIQAFLDYVNEKNPDINKVYTTNGTPLLNNEVLTRLTKTKTAILVSLHASNSQLHRLLTKMNTFDQIVSDIKRLVSMRKDQSHPSVSLIFLINTLNIENLPDFVEFAAGLGVDEVICNYLTIFNLSHLKLSCFFKQEVTNESFKKAEELAKKLNFRLRLPLYFGVDSQYGKIPLCSDPWKYCYIENEGSVLPCCYAGGHFGYLGEADFETIWNGANYKHLRSSLVKGPNHEWCNYCLKYCGKNVNDLRSHINFRTGCRDKILRGYRL